MVESSNIERVIGAGAERYHRIACYNEELTIGKVIGDCRPALPGCNIYVFDNSSTDAFAAKARARGATVFLELSQGRGYIVQSMFRSVEADVYVIVDGGARYPADQVGCLIDPVLRGNADMVIGSRLHEAAKTIFGGVGLCLILLAIVPGAISLVPAWQGPHAALILIVASALAIAGLLLIASGLLLHTVPRHFQKLEVQLQLLADDLYTYGRREVD